jgi:hypothetical protein
LHTASENDVVMVVSNPGVTVNGVKIVPSREPFAHSKMSIIWALSGNRVRVNRPSESVRMVGSSMLRPLLSMRRTRMANAGIGAPVSALVTTPWTRRGL